jgi:hypothetical protein
MGLRAPVRKDMEPTAVAAILGHEAFIRGPSVADPTHGIIGQYLRELSPKLPEYRNRPKEREENLPIFYGTI